MGRATNCERTPTKSDGQTTWWLPRKNVARNGKWMKNTHKRRKKKLKGWLSGWVVEVHRRHAKALAPGSPTQKFLDLSSVECITKHMSKNRGANVLWCFCFV